MTAPTCWYEVSLRGDHGPLPKFYTARDAEACCWLLWDKHKALYDVFEVEGGERTLVLTVPPGTDEAN